jgi:uncharacterized protein
MAVEPAADLVDASGSLFNCTEVSYVSGYEGEAGRLLAQKLRLPVLPSTVAGSSNVYAIGNLAHGEAPGKRHVLGNFNERVANNEYACSKCNLFPVCGGRCPKLWLEGVVPCPPAKYNIEQRLLLAYLLAGRGWQIKDVIRKEVREAVLNPDAYG